MDPNVQKYLKETKRKVESYLRRLLPPGRAYPSVIHAAMRYSTLAGGKRIRPLIVLAGHAMLGGRSRTIIKTACAIELLHTYSMIHDDLPCMDDDDLRRGKPTLHKVYGEAVAVLAGDALNARAFELLAACPDRRVGLAIAQATGSQGMIGGQVMDVLQEGKPVSKREIRYIHTHKTGKLISVCAKVSALEAGASPKVVDDFAGWGAQLGLAFQIIDDILDVKGTEKKLGKRIGADVQRQKNTYPLIFGLEQSERMARALARQACQRIARYPRAEVMLALADLIVNRIS
jgi:geranylgeranyl diphosphate synthase type II